MSQTSLNILVTATTAQAQAQLAAVNTQMKTMAAQAGVSGGALGKIGKGAVGIAAVGAAAVIAGKQLYDLGKEFDEAYDKIMSTNVKANLWLANMVAPDMVKRGSGSIMITSSTGAFSASLNLGTYNISKLAVIALVRNLAAELGPRGVRVNAICPGLIRTDFAQALWDNPEAEQRANEQIPLRRLGEAEDLKGLAVFLASDASSYITGQALTVCGGSNMWS